MSIKICLILFGTLIALAVQNPDEKTKKNGLSPEVVISERLGRSASRKRKTSKKNQKSSRKKASRKIQKSRIIKNVKKIGKRKLKKDKKKIKKIKLSREIGQKKGKNNSRQVLQDIPVLETCLKDSVVSLYNGLRMASNFDRQLKRLQTWNQTITNKLKRAGDFKQSSVLIENFASECPYENYKLAAKILGTKLGTCQTNITDICQPPEVNQTKIEECTIPNDGFKSKMEECFDVTSTSGVEEACKCWESDTLTDLFEKLKKCIIKELETDVKERSKECKTAVTDCKKSQTEFLPLYKQCTTKLQCPDVGLSCIGSDNIVKNGVIENSSMLNCSNNLFKDQNGIDVIFLI